MRTKTISLDLFGDHPPWAGYDWSCGDNSAAIHAIQKALLAAIDAELTDSQRRVIYGSYFEGKTITAIAAEMGVNKSTVASIGTSAVLGDVNWAAVASASALAGILSLATSVAGLPELKEG